MIVYPEDWRSFGSPVTTGDIDKAMREVLEGIDCNNLSFSGGVDSSLLLYYLLEVHGVAQVFTIANLSDHPDILFAEKSLHYFEERYGIKIPHTVFVRPNIEGDELVRCFYNLLSDSGVRRIIAGDCVDELACGYYAHQDMTEETYYGYLRRSQGDHLEPLNKNSGDIGVYLPYADCRVASLFYQMPLQDKVSHECRKIAILSLADGRVAPEVIERKKYGFATSVQEASV